MKEIDLCSVRALRELLNLLFYFVFDISSFEGGWRWHYWYQRWRVVSVEMWQPRASNWRPSFSRLPGIVSTHSISPFEIFFEF